MKRLSGLSKRFFLASLLLIAIVGTLSFVQLGTGSSLSFNLPTATGPDGASDHGDVQVPIHQNCHFHAGVEHCVSTGTITPAKKGCERVDYEYDVSLRVWLLLAIFLTSGFGVFAPIIILMVIPPKANAVLLGLRQFGTGVIISTAFVHLFTHSIIMFGNECVGDLGYEAVPALILMAGMLVSFMVEYVSYRLIQRQNKKAIINLLEASTNKGSQELLSVLIMEAGVNFHSIFVGLTLVVTGDSYIITLFIVIAFHQFFEGIALGSRIASLGQPISTKRATYSHCHGHSPKETTASLLEGVSSASRVLPTSVHATSQGEETTIGLRSKCFMALAFAFITPLGMLIGIAVLRSFNGNDPKTLIGIGTLDAFSAGILVWVGIVEMWAQDWMGGELSESSFLTTATAGFSLFLGMALMAFLGKWA